MASFRISRIGSAYSFVQLIIFIGEFNSETWKYNEKTNLDL
jgi:hypothetical protein